MPYDGLGPGWSYSMSTKLGAASPPSVRVVPASRSYAWNLLSFHYRKVLPSRRDATRAGPVRWSFAMSVRSPVDVLTR